jgi:hypothetical protein
VICSSRAAPTLNTFLPLAVNAQSSCGTACPAPAVLAFAQGTSSGSYDGSRLISFMPATSTTVFAGTVYNTTTATSTRRCLVSSAVYIDPIGSDFSVSAWVKFSSERQPFSASTQLQCNNDPGLFSCRFNTIISTDRFVLSVLTSGGSNNSDLALYLQVGFDTAAGQKISMDVGAPFARVFVDQWVHVVAIVSQYAHFNASLWLNGTMVQSQSQPIGTNRIRASSATNRLAIGCRNLPLSNNKSNFFGAISHVAVFADALTPTEVQQVYSNTNATLLVIPMRSLAPTASPTADSPTSAASLSPTSSSNKPPYPTTTPTTASTPSSTSMMPTIVTEDSAASSTFITPNSTALPISTATIFGTPDDTAVIAGAVGGSIGTLLLSGLIAFCVCRTRKSRPRAAGRSLDRTPATEPRQTHPGCVFDCIWLLRCRHHTAAHCVSLVSAILIVAAWRVAARAVGSV